MRHIAVALAIGTALVPWTGATPLPATGRADYYAPALMQRVYAHRLAWKQVQICPECIGFVAMMRSGDIGRRVWLQRTGYPREGPYLSVDCAGANHFAQRMVVGSVVEVDYQTAQRWTMTGPITVTVGEWQDAKEAYHGTY